MKKVNLLSKLLLFSFITLLCFNSYSQQFGNGVGIALNNYNINSNHISSGYYSLYKAINAPTVGLWHHFITYKHPHNNGYALQMSSQYFQSDRMFFRLVNGNTPGPWREIATRGNNTFVGNQVLNGNLNISGVSNFSDTLFINEENEKPLKIYNHNNTAYITKNTSVPWYNDRKVGLAISSETGTVYIGNLMDNFRSGTDNMGRVDTTFPNAKLEIRTAMYPHPTSEAKSIGIKTLSHIGTNIFAETASGIAIHTKAGAYGSGRAIYSEASDISFSGLFKGGNFSISRDSHSYYDTLATPDFFVNAAGYITMGTLTVYGANIGDPYKLSVNGKIACKELKVDVNWADFVFEEDYNLRSIYEVEQFIKTNKHLPDVLPGSVVETEGLKVGEMQAVMMQKIEELTLYIIQQQKQIDELQSKVK